MTTTTEEDVARATEIADWYDTATVNLDDLREVIALALAETREAERARCAVVAEISAYEAGRHIAAAIRTKDYLPVDHKGYPSAPVSAVDAASRMRAQEQWEIDDTDKEHRT